MIILRTAHLIVRLVYAIQLPTVILLLAVAAVASAADLEKELPSDTGWRSVRWGMTTAEVSTILGADLIEEKKGKAANDPAVAVHRTLKTKVQMDGLEYEVKLDFSSDRLNQIRFGCGKASAESVSSIRSSLIRLYGDVYSREFNLYRIGTIDPLKYEGTSWRAGKRKVTLLSIWSKPKVLGTLGINVWVPASEEDFGVRGTCTFAGNVHLRRHISPESLNDMKKVVPRPFGTEESCFLEINGSRQSIKATCNKSVTVDQVLGNTDRIILETPGMHFSTKGNPKPFFFKFFSEEIFTQLAEAFPERIEKISFPEPSPIDKKLLKDVGANHSTKPDYQSRPALAPETGKALLVAIRPREIEEGFGWGLQEKIHVDDRVVLVNLAGTYSAVQVEPGEHSVAAQGGARRAMQMRMSFEAGKIYYFLHGDEFLRRVSDDLGLFEISYAYPSVTQRK